MNPSWYLENADHIAAASKYTFYKPSREVIARLGPGNICKLIFAFESDASSHPAAERMWVEIKHFENGQFSGILDNDPLYIKDLQAGDPIAFGPEHIIDLDVPDEEPNLTEQYSQLCFTTRRIIDEGRQIGYFYREEPMEGERNGMVDSGWKFLEGDEEQTYIDDLKNVQFISLGKLLNADDSFVHLLCEPIGSAFIRNAATGDFERLHSNESDMNTDNQKSIDPTPASPERSPWWKFWT